MGEFNLSETLVDKVATLGVGCCALALGSHSPEAISEVAVTAASVATVLGVGALRGAIGHRPECRKALDSLMKTAPRVFPTLAEANEGAVRQAADALDAALDRADVATVERLRGALQDESRLVEGLTQANLEAVAQIDQRFAEDGLYRDFAQWLFTQAFERAREACEEFQARAILTLAELNLEETRRLSAQVETLTKVISTLRDNQSDRGKAPTDERDDPLISLSLQQQLLNFGVQADKLTAEQFRVIDYFRRFRRARVDGCAGSGKTLIACEKATRLAASGLRTLLLCHNPLLAEYMRSLLADSTIKVLSFAQLITVLAELDNNGVTSFRWNIYEEPHDLVLGQAFDLATTKFEPFDAIIVDEGQDFKSEWWLLVEALLRDPNESHLYIFEDEHQSIHVGRSEYPISIPPIEISRNCRNSAHVLRVVRHFAPTAPETDQLLRNTGFVHIYRESHGSSADGLALLVKDALEMGFKPKQLIAIALGISDPDAVLGGSQLAVSATEPWRGAVIRYLVSAASSRHTYFSVINKDGLLHRLEDLSWAAYPTHQDVNLVVECAKAHFEVTKDAIRYKQRMQALPEWHTEGRLLSLKRHGYPCHNLDAVMHFRSSDWANSIPKPKMVTIRSEDPRRGVDDLLLVDAGTAKGLEAEVALIVLSNHRPISRVERYIATSRARFGLMIYDPYDEFKTVNDSRVYQNFATNPTT